MVTDDCWWQDGGVPFLPLPLNFTSVPPRQDARREWGSVIIIIGPGERRVLFLLTLGVKCKQHHIRRERGLTDEQANVVCFSVVSRNKDVVHLGEEKGVSFFFWREEKEEQSSKKSRDVNSCTHIVTLARSLPAWSRANKIKKRSSLF